MIKTFTFFKKHLENHKRILAKQLSPEIRLFFGMKEKSVKQKYETLKYKIFPEKLKDVFKAIFEGVKNKIL